MQGVAKFSGYIRVFLKQVMARRRIIIKHRDSGVPLAAGPIGWGITPFEGNYYIRRIYLLTDRFKKNYVPGLCPYKFLYVWLDLILPDGNRSKNLGWMYCLPNPLLPFIWYRVAIPQSHPELILEEYSASASEAEKRLEPVLAPAFDITGICPEAGAQPAETTDSSDGLRLYV